MIYTLGSVNKRGQAHIVWTMPVPSCTLDDGAVPCIWPDMLLNASSKTKLMQRYDCRTLRDLEDELQRRGVLAEHATVLPISLSCSCA